MVKVNIKSDKKGALLFCCSTGHAVSGFSQKCNFVKKIKLLFGKKQNPVCLCVSDFLFTVLEQLNCYSSVRLEWSAPKRGELTFKVCSYDDSDLQLLRYGFDFLKTGFSKLVQQYPTRISLNIEEAI